jgi:hypothetical protein
MCSIVFCVNEDEGIKLSNFEKYFLNPETILHMKWHYVSNKRTKRLKLTQFQLAHSMKQGNAHSISS